MGDEVLCISLLGAFSITLGENAVPDSAWRLRKAKTLIKLLALAPEQRLHADLAAELLWADRDPASAPNNLHQAIFTARRALDSIGTEGRRLLELQQDVIALCPRDPVWIDVVAFEEAAAKAGEDGDPAPVNPDLAMAHGSGDDDAPATGGVGPDRVLDPAAAQPSQVPIVDHRVLGHEQLQHDPQIGAVGRQLGDRHAQVEGGARRPRTFH